MKQSLDMDKLILNIVETRDVSTVKHTMIIGGGTVV